MLRVLITGSDGFIARNLISHLSEMKDIDIVKFSRQNSRQDLVEMSSNIDFVFHLAGVNRSLDDYEFVEGNFHLTEFLCETLVSAGRKIPLIFSSSSQAIKNNPYGKSKLSAENTISDYAKSTGSDVYIYRFPNIFGKWCKPNYNSVVATFCNNIANNLPIQIHNYDHEISLMYIDDVISEFISVLVNRITSPGLDNIPMYTITLGNLADKISEFHDSRGSLVLDRVGSGLIRALYATYLSYLRPEMFSYSLNTHSDERGIFAEVLKTKDSGQLSFFTSKIGEIRGEHYHHTKNEKFLVVLGKAKFNFHNIMTNEEYSIDTNSNKLEIVETVPGWAHNIENIGDTEMLVILWANEVFNEEESDTHTYLIDNEKT